MAASLLLMLSQVLAQPPSAHTPVTSAATVAYQLCLAKELSTLPTLVAPQAVIGATQSCANEEVALSASVLKENPDRPLFAQSYAQSLKDEVIAQLVPAKLPATTGLAARVAQRTRP